MKMYLSLFVVLMVGTYGDLAASDLSEVPMKQTDLVGPIADFRWRFFDVEVVKALEKKGAVLIDDTGMLRGGIWETPAQGNVRAMVTNLYSVRKRSFLTIHYLVIVQRDRILKVKFRSFEDIPADLVAESGDVVLMYEVS